MFFARDTLAVARDLLGHLLVHETPQGRTIGRIVEVEAYRGAKDRASHAYRLTPRSRIMAGPPGIAYVYFSYGNHFCVNVVTGPEGVAGAVLLRALEPIDGIALMAARRGIALPPDFSGMADGSEEGPPRAAVQRLAGGPGRLTRAMGIGREHNGADLTRPPLFIAHGRPGILVIGSSPRVGISRAAGRQWRFFVRGNPYVSRQGAPHAAR